MSTAPSRHGADVLDDVHIQIDSRWLTVHVEQLRNPPKNRKYRKFHLCVDEHSGCVVVGELTRSSTREPTHARRGSEWCNAVL